MNRKYDSLDGPKCSLTNKVADFENFCEKYDIDLNTLSFIQSEMSKEIEQKYPKKNLFNWLVLGSYLDEKEKIESSKSKKTVFKERKYFAYVLFIFFGVFLVHLIFQHFSGQLNHMSIFEKILVLSLMLFILTISGYSTFFPKQRQLIIFRKDFLQYKTRKTIFHKTKENKIFWREITNLRFYEMGEWAYTVIIGTISKGIVEIDISDLNTNPREFIRLIKTQAKNVAQHNL